MTEVKGKERATSDNCHNTRSTSQQETGEMSDLESLVSDSEVGIIISLSWTLDFFLILIRKLALFSFSPLRACISQRRNQWFRQRGHGTRTLTKFFPTSGYSWTFIEIVVFDPNLVGRLPKNLTSSRSHWTGEPIDIWLWNSQRLGA